MKISVLILTHNRPQLFKRCLDSVTHAYRYWKTDLEVLVNNDSDDITELYHDTVTYSYNKSDNLSDLYRDLFERATGDYVYFLEDDDVMSIDFFYEVSKRQADIMYFNYIPHKWEQSMIGFFEYTNKKCTKDEFLDRYDDHHFQFSQIFFKKKCLDINQFPTDNNLHNDFKIFQRLKGSFVTIPKFLYRQTTDGGDNISFKSLNKDERWIT